MVPDRWTPLPKWSRWLRRSSANLMTSNKHCAPNCVSTKPTCRLSMRCFYTNCSRKLVKSRTVPKKSRTGPKLSRRVNPKNVGPVVLGPGALHQGLYLSCVSVPSAHHAGLGHTHLRFKYFWPPISDCRSRDCPSGWPRGSKRSLCGVSRSALLTAR